MAEPDVAALQAQLEAMKAQAAAQFHNLLTAPGPAPTSATFEGFKQWRHSGALGTTPGTWENYQRALDKASQVNAQRNAQAFADWFANCRATINQLTQQLAALRANAAAPAVQVGRSVAPNAPAIVSTLEQNAPALAPTAAAVAVDAARPGITPGKVVLAGVVITLMTAPILWWMGVRGDDTPAATPPPAAAPFDTASPDAGTGGSNPPAKSGITLSGTFVITEDKSRFSPAPFPAPDDPLGCTGRRVPSEIHVTPIDRPPGRITFRFAEEPGSPPFDHPGFIDASHAWSVRYPDTGTLIEGQFVEANGGTEIVDGHMYSGYCTFFYTGKRKS